MTDKNRTFAQDGFVATPRIVTEGKVIVQNGYRPTPTVSTAQTQNQPQTSGDKK
ncbi:hypothetical protein O9X90_00815 [Agrobacterium leguminum]|uniref:hypothetical protein n=1 Tax=Agrobacterium TaxID=357 RepID=UPI0022B855F6|nr:MULTISPECIES: hypothetical protein [Agrobacterium]MCZ7930842.1 hypothetical protein [Agrobacterium leguminum]MDR5009447.1 hypothetical protein [Agrobacterium tumefaciens]